MRACRPAHHATLGFVTAALTAVVLTAAATPALARTLVVATDGKGTASNCDDPRATPYTTIASAVAAAAPNDTVKVCAGVYNEQVTITKALRLHGENGAIVRPAPMVANTTSLTTGRALASAILVMDTTRVTIEGLTIDGADLAISGCSPSPSPFGIFFRNASGVIQNNTIRNVRLLPGSESCPDGTGILVQSGGGGSSNVTIQYNSIHGYQKNGMTLNEAGTVVRVGPGNVVIGSGPTTGTNQAGIQLAFGATGRVTGNTVANHVAADCVDAATCGANGSDVLIFQGTGIEVSWNQLGTSQTGVQLTGDSNTVVGNVIVDTLVYDGIFVSGDGNTVKANVITRSAESAIFLDGSGNVVTGNRIQDAPVGIMGASGNTVRTNTFVNTPVRESTGGP